MPKKAVSSKKSSADFGRRGPRGQPDGHLGGLGGRNGEELEHPLQKPQNAACVALDVRPHQQAGIDDRRADARAFQARGQLEAEDVARSWRGRRGKKRERKRSRRLPTVWSGGDGSGRRFRPGALPDVGALPDEGGEVFEEAGQCFARALVGEASFARKLFVGLFDLHRRRGGEHFREGSIRGRGATRPARGACRLRSATRP